MKHLMFESVARHFLIYIIYTVSNGATCRTPTILNVCLTMNFSVKQNGTTSKRASKVNQLPFSF